jgi:hypothetical protein
VSHQATTKINKQYTAKEPEHIIIKRKPLSKHKRRLALIEEVVKFMHNRARHYSLRLPADLDLHLYALLIIEDKYDE